MNATSPPAAGEAFDAEGWRGLASGLSLVTAGQAVTLITDGTSWFVFDEGMGSMWRGASAPLRLTRR